MWRKNEEPKASAPVSSAEPKEHARVEPPTVAPAASSAASAPLAAPPAGHLTASLTIKGEITGREDFYIDGEVQGKVRLEDGRVTVGPNGRVTADIEAREIVIRGTVKGNLHARDRVQIGQTGSATGNVVTRRISIDDGAELRGKVEVVRAEEARPSRPNGAANGELRPQAVAMQAKEAPTNA
jgi:cytoskeletal protein CcmA (bactofilin family)